MGIPKIILPIEVAKFIINTGNCVPVNGNKYYWIPFYFKSENNNDKTIECISFSKLPRELIDEIDKQRGVKTPSFEAIEDNKIIAEFMGKSYQFIEDLQYHSDWNSLMPVVKKIIHTAWNIENAFRKCCLVSDTLNYIEIEKTFISVVEFIKWYNNQNK